MTVPEERLTRMQLDLAVEIAVRIAEFMRGRPTLPDLVPEPGSVASGEEHRDLSMTMYLLLANAIDHILGADRLVRSAHEVTGEVRYGEPQRYAVFSAIRGAMESGSTARWLIGSGRNETTIDRRTRHAHLVWHRRSVASVLSGNCSAERLRLSNMRSICPRLSGSPAKSDYR